MSNKTKSGQLDFHKNSYFKQYHYYFTQLPNLLLLEVFSAIMYIYYSEKFIISFYCLPIVLIYLYIIYKFAWGGDWRCLSRKFLLSMIGLFICAPIFFSAYFFVWDPTLSLVWFKSDNCKSLGQRVTFLANLERYGLQYIQITSELVGLSCISNRKSSGNQLKSYDFYEKGEYYSCDSHYDQTNRTHIINNTYFNISNRLLENTFEQQNYYPDSKYQVKDYSSEKDTEYIKEVLEREQNKEMHSNLSYLPQQSEISNIDLDESYQRNLNTQLQKDNQKNQDSFQKSNSIRRCRVQYIFSQVKLPSWICQSSEENKILQEKMASHQDYGQQCYYAYYGSKDLARINSRSLTKDLIKEKDLLIVKFEENSYYFKEGFIALIVLTMIPTMLFSFQSLFSFFVYEAILFLCSEYIEAENEQIKRQSGALEMQSQKQAEGDQNSTSQTDRQQQKIEPFQIVQILSPNSQQKDRDVYDIYNNTRRKQQTQLLNPTINVNTEDPINVTKFNGDSTKSVMIKKSPKSANKAQSIDEIEDNKRECLNGPRNITEKFMQDSTSSSEEEVNDNDSSYLKIRNIYKKKLNPNYQKQVQQKKREGVEVENEEIKIIQEIKEKQKLAQEKLKEKRDKKKKKKESPTLDQTINDQNDLHNILDVSTLALPQQGKSNEDEEKIKDTNNNQADEKVKDEENKNQEVDAKQNNQILESEDQQKEQEDTKQSQQIEEAYKFYEQQVDNSERLETPPQDVELIK